MPTRATTWSLAALAVGALGCDPAPAKTETQPAKPAAQARPAQAAGPGKAPDNAPNNLPDNEDAVSHDEPAPLSPPPWFSEEAFEHVDVLREDLRGSEGPDGRRSAMLLLALQAETTPAQCIERARAKLGETIATLPETTTTPQGYLSLQGKADTYEFNIVCGLAKGSPTMFASFTR